MSDPNASASAPVEAAGPRPALDKKKTIIGAVIGVVALGLIFFKVIPQIGSYEDAWTAIQAMNAFDIAVIVACVLVYNVVYGFPFMAAVPGLSYPRSFQLNQGAFAISNGIPAGGAFGLGVQYAMLASYQVQPTVATAAIGATGVWSIFVTLGLPVFGLMAIAASGTISAGQYVYIGAIGLGVLLAMIIVFALVMRSEPLAIRIGGWGNAVARPLFKAIRKEAPDLVPVVVKFRTDTVDLVSKRWHVITVSQVAVSLCQFAIFYAALRGVEGTGTQTPFLVAFGAWAVAQIGIMIPITPGGLGTVDAFMISLLTAMGVSSGDATAADLVWRAASFVPQIVIGILALVTWSKRAAQTFAASAPAPAAD
ncbi:MAG: lysylphosphatidylglycerol synthase transmembrane domain-containing protein [Candidatus Nanopelagicales bacterium]